MFFGKVTSVEHLGAQTERGQAVWGILWGAAGAGTPLQRIPLKSGASFTQGFPSPVQAVGTRNPQPTDVFSLQSRFWGCCYHFPLKHSSAHRIFFLFLH